MGYMNTDRPLSPHIIAALAFFLTGSLYFKPYRLIAHYDTDYQPHSTAATSRAAFPGPVGFQSWQSQLTLLTLSHHQKKTRN